jgi:hypothetical protein
MRLQVKEEGVVDSPAALRFERRVETLIWKQDAIRAYL